jgi:hypothetical protein
VECCRTTFRTVLKNIAGFSVRHRKYCRISVHGFLPEGDEDAASYLLSLHDRGAGHGDARFLAVCLNG